MACENKTILVDKIPVSYRGYGLSETKPAVLFLHGWGSNKESFKAIESQFPRSIALDLPGFGATPLGSGEWDIERYAGFVEQVIDKLGLSLEVIIGHSFGGRIATQVAKNQVVGFDCLVFTGTPFFRERTNIHSLTPLLKWVKYVPGGRKIRRYVYRHMLKADDYLEAEETSLAPVFRNIIAKEVAEDLHLLQQSTLLLWGEDDVTVPLGQALRAATLIPHVSTELIKGAGHFPFVDKPEEFVARYQAWRKTLV